MSHAFHLHYRRWWLVLDLFLSDIVTVLSSPTLVVQLIVIVMDVGVSISHHLHCVKLSPPFPLALHSFATLLSPTSHRLSLNPITSSTTTRVGGSHQRSLLLKPPCVALLSSLSTVLSTSHRFLFVMSYN
ncbi:hypothetical protein VNO77_33774 [Canavalia gladiata]|uniref:Uncharacterized protein n=1 Tax=Canavalia gladiata TaxID=3824 RepID=A0AAN9KD39_CANGL